MLKKHLNFPEFYYGLFTLKSNPRKNHVKAYIFQSKHCKEKPLHTSKWLTVDSSYESLQSIMASQSEIHQMLMRCREVLSE